MPQDRFVPASDLRLDMKVKNSLFIASLKPVFSQDAAREFIRQINEEFSDASHNVPAYLVGTGGGGGALQR